MQFGEVCKDCKGIEKCRDVPSAASPLEMRCVGCGGGGCEQCQNTGAITITGCPMEMITSEVCEVIALTELFEKGLPPVAGGTLDQAKIFVDAARFIFGEQQHWKKKLGMLK